MVHYELPARLAVVNVAPAGDKFTVRVDENSDVFPIRRPPGIAFSNLRVGSGKDGFGCSRERDYRPEVGVVVPAFEAETAGTAVGHQRLPCAAFSDEQQGIGGDKGDEDEGFDCFVPVDAHRVEFDGQGSCFFVGIWCTQLPFVSSFSKSIYEIFKIYGSLDLVVMCLLEIAPGPAVKLWPEIL